MLRLAKANLNTILTVVSWDLVEPEEGKFDFSMIDYQIEAARANNVRLIVLWMASWKNGLSHFPPAWVKANQDRFPRVVNGRGPHAGDSLDAQPGQSRCRRQGLRRRHEAHSRGRFQASHRHRDAGGERSGRHGQHARLLPRGQRRLRRAGPHGADRLSPDRTRTTCCRN